MIGLLSAAAFLLGAAGAAKLVGPPGVSSALATARLPGAGRLPARIAGRISGLIELAVAVAALALGGRVGAALIALGYAVLAALSIRLMSMARGADCGCFGRPNRMNHWHTAVNLGYLLVGVAGMCRPAGTPAGLLADRPGIGVVSLLAAASLAYLSYLLMTALADLLRLAARLEVAR
ncbi:MAG TPA: MauE/DoxX family redox-associated membrane protein [Jatrophihabitans sp.]|nr:MauE/DoxX family redox-associated membrane protein [Jatrophihabitans sp.]